MHTNHRNTSRRHRAIGGAAVLVTLVAAAGCSGEDIAERAIEEGIERESGDDVDIDLDDGNIRIETEDGVVEMNTDGDGNVSIEGEGVDGDFSIDSEDGVTVIESEDGSTVISSGNGELPEGFPVDIPLPDGLQIQLSQSMDVGGGQQGWIVAGEAPGEWQPYADELVAALEGAGYEQVQVTTAPTGVFLNFARDGVAVFGTVGEGGQPGTTAIALQAGT